MNSLGQNHTGFESRCLIPKIASMGLPWKGLLYPEDRGRDRWREVPSWHCIMLISLKSDWRKHQAQSVATSVTHLSHSPWGSPGVGHYFSPTFLEYLMIHPWSMNFLTLFPWKNFLLAAGLHGNAQNLHKQRKRDTLGATSPVSPISMTHWSLIIY